MPTPLFQKGENWTGNAEGRPRGTLNKTTQVLKEALIISAHNVGDEIGNAQIEAGAATANGGLVGYLETIARDHPTSFCSLLGRVLPLVLQGSIDHTHKAEVQARAERFTTAMQQLIDRHNARAN